MTEKTITFNKKNLDHFLTLISCKLQRESSIYIIDDRIICHSEDGNNIGLNAINEDLFLKNNLENLLKKLLLKFSKTLDYSRSESISTSIDCDWSYGQEVGRFLDNVLPEIDFFHIASLIEELHKKSQELQELINK